MSGKFFFAIGLLLPAVVAVALIGLFGLTRMRENIEEIHREQVQTVHQLSDVQNAFDTARAVAAESIAQRRSLKNQTADARFATLSRDIDADLTTLAQLSAHESDEANALEDLRSRWERFEQARELGRFEPNSSFDARETQRKVLGEMLDPAVAATQTLLDEEFDEVADARADSRRTFTTSRWLLIVALVISVLLVVAAASWLIRVFVPRIRDYSTFADEVARGNTGGRVHPTGNDELSDLGNTLNRMVERRELERLRERRQSEFSETLQVTENEDEAHDVLRRHLERSLEDASVFVLTRNNSADRLDAAGSVGDPALRERLEGTQPRSCLAVRFGRVHHEDPDDSPLVRCEICCDERKRALCTPLLVGGEVIGSVLVQQEAPINDESRTTLRETVTQAAPVVGNLRNLAIAELRAATDSLTGLPNQRAAHATLTRLVALAMRTKSPLSALLLDLDHFKRINDTLGHGAGDEALAASAAAITSAVRESDFAARYGGEEFLILLPETDLVGARVAGEKVRRAVEVTTIASVPQGVTASIGIAVLPHDASTVEALIRAADRALYSAKGAGRNRVAVFEPGGAEVADGPTGTSRTDGGALSDQSERPQNLAGLAGPSDPEAGDPVRQPSSASTHGAQ